MNDNKNTVEVDEIYKDYDPSISLKGTVSRLLDGIPNKYIAGLKQIKLTNATGLNHKRKRQKVRSRNKKIAIRKSRGLYHHNSKNNPAWIEIFVDNTLEIWPKLLFRIPVFRDMAISDVLFHELGHHIYETQAPEYNDIENVADKRRAKLNIIYFKKRYWYFAPFVFIL